MSRQQFPSSQASPSSTTADMSCLLPCSLNEDQRSDVGNCIRIGEEWFVGRKKYNHGHPLGGDRAAKCMQTMSKKPETMVDALMDPGGGGQSHPSEARWRHPHSYHPAGGS